MSRLLRWVSGCSVPCLVAFVWACLGSGLGAAAAGTIGGVVLDLEGHPIGGATVTVSASGAAPQRLVTTESGQFVCTVSAGRYQVSASKPGFLSEATAKQYVAEVWPEVTIAKDDERVLGLVLRLSTGAVISGNVFDDANDPVAGLQVRLLRASAVGGREVFEPSPFGSTALKARTNDRGEYRFSGLSPGKYLVGVFPERTPSKSSTGAVFDLPWLYPRTHDLSAAQPINVASAEVRPAIDIHLQSQTGRSVAGRVVGVSDSRQLVVKLVRASVEPARGEIEMARATTEIGGEFVMANIPPCRYTLSIVEYPRGPDNDVLRFLNAVDTKGGALVIGRRDQVTKPTDLAPTYWASVAVDVGVEKDVSDLSVPVQLGASICGRVEFDGDSARPSATVLSAADVWIMRADQTIVESPVAALNSDGQFCSVGLAPGKYQIQVMGRLAGWHLRSVRQNGRNVTGAPVDPSSEVIVTYTDRSSDLQGTVRNRKGDVVPNASVLVFPADRALWSDFGPLPALVRHVRADSTGGFRLANMIEGKYRVVALSEPAREDWTLQENLGVLSAFAIDAQVDLRGSVVVSLVAVPFPVR